MNENWIITQIESFVHKYYALYKKYDYKWGELKRLTEFEFLLDDVIEMCILDPIDKINLMRISQCISDEMRFDKIIFYYSSFHYFFNKITHNDIEDISGMIYQMNIQINIVRIQIKHSMITGCSEDDYFFKERGNELVSAIEIMCHRGERKGFKYNPIMYLLLNYEQALLEYLESENKHYFDSACELSRRCMDIIKEFCTKFVQIQTEIKENVKLKMFIYDIYYKYYRIVENKVPSGFTDKLKCIEDSEIITNNIWALINIYDLDEKYFITYFEKYLLNANQYYDKLLEDSKIMYLRNCVRLMKINHSNKVGVMKLPPIKETYDKSWFNIDDYIRGYSNSSSVDITDIDIRTVEGYNDEVLRRKFANILTNIDEHIINKECTKPHSGFEIADMELPIRRQTCMETYYICIPVKSGIEISKKVTEEIVYQVIRPFTYFGNKAIVIFISAKEGTESFYNYVKRAQANLDLDIYIIAGKALVRLLKYNKQIES